MLTPLLTAVTFGLMRPRPIIHAPPQIQYPQGNVRNIQDDEDVQRMKRELEELKRKADAEMAKRLETERLVEERFVVCPMPNTVPSGD